MQHNTILVPTRKPVHKFWRKLPKNPKKSEDLFLALKNGIKSDEFIKKFGKMAVAAKVNADFVIGLTALMYSCKMEMIEIALWLIENGADVNERDHSVFGCEKVADWGGRTALHYAIRRNYNSYGPTHKTMTDAMHYTPDRGEYLRSLPEINIRLITELISHGANVNVYDGNGDTPLSLASEYGDYNAVKLLLENGANPNIAKHNHIGAIDGAVGTKNIELLKLFVRYKANIHRVSHVGTLLNSCILTESGAWIDGLRYLLKIGLDPCLTDPHDGRTAIFSAIAVEDYECVDVLLNHNRKLAVMVDVNGVSPIKWAQEIGCGRIVKLLRKYGQMV